MRSLLRLILFYFLFSVAVSQPVERVRKSLVVEKWVCPMDSLRDLVSTVMSDPQYNTNVDDIETQIKLKLFQLLGIASRNWLISVSAFTRSVGNTGTAIDTSTTFCSLFNDNTQVVLAKLA